MSIYYTDYYKRENWKHVLERIPILHWNVKSGKQGNVLEYIQNLYNRIIIDIWNYSSTWKHLQGRKNLCVKIANNDKVFHELETSF